jgi:hypothetical protein
MENTNSSSESAGMAGRYADIKLPHTSIIATEEFLRMEMYSGNRNSYNRVKKIVPFLQFPRATATIVSIGILDGVSYRLDGNTRAFAWAEADKWKIEVPQRLLAHVFLCDSEDDLQKLYNSLDNYKAAETASDKMAGLFRLAGKDPLSWESFKLQNGQVVKAIKNGFPHLKLNLDNPLDAVEKIKPLIPFLEQIDPIINLKGARHHAADLCAAILMLEKYQDDLFAIERFLHGFENLVMRHVEYKKADGKDAITYLYEDMGTHWGASWGYTNGNQMPLEIACNLYYYEKWMRDEKIKKGKKNGFIDWYKQEWKPTVTNRNVSKTFNIK